MEGQINLEFIFNNKTQNNCLGANQKNNCSTKVHIGGYLLILLFINILH